MPSIAHLTGAVDRLIAEAVPELRAAARARLVFLVIGLLLAGTAVLRRIAITHALIASSVAHAASHERRLRRTLADTNLQATPVYGRVIRRILQHVRPGQRITIIIDETAHTARFRVLMAALAYRGRAIPLAWVLWPGQQPRDQPFWTDCGTLLDAVVPLLPHGVAVTVVADRAFGCPAFIDQLQAHGWDYVVRVQRPTRFRPDSQPEVALGHLLTAPGTWWYGEGQLFKQAGWRTAQVVAYWRKGCGGPLLLVSSLRQRGSLVRVYRQRSWIETLFRDWKRHGWQWEQSQVRQLDHAAVLLEVLALATALTLCLGAEAATTVIAQGRQSGRRRPWAARDSLFRLGRDYLWQRIWRGRTDPIAWELPDVGGPAWSIACWTAACPDVAVVHQTERTGPRERMRRAA